MHTYQVLGGQWLPVSMRQLKSASTVLETGGRVAKSPAEGALEQSEPLA